MTWFLDLRATAVGGITAAEVTARRDGDAIDVATLRDRAAGRDVLFATHGFNVDRQHGIASLGNWERWLQLAPGSLFIGILWAGDSRWAPVIDFPVEGDEAIQSAKLLAPFLATHFAHAASLSFVSHSLGARLVLHTIRLLRRRIRRLVVMAGAIEDDCLSHEYRDAASYIDSVSVLASRSDAVLRHAFPMGNLGRELIDAQHPHWSAALGHTGPAVPVSGLHAGWQIPTRWNYGHGDYLAQTSGGLPFVLPVDVPDAEPPAPRNDANWKPAWSAGLVSSRFR